MRKFLLILLLLVLAAFFCRNAEAQQVMTQYLPHIVAGSLPDSEWDTVIEPKCLSSLPCPMTIEFFNSIGDPLVLDTNQGMSNRFDVVVSPGVPGPGSFVIHVRRGQQLVSGWARVTSTSTFSGIGKFRQFMPGGAEPIGVASVFFSPSDIVLTFDLKPSNGIALINPSTADATVTVTALTGRVEEKRTFTLVKGGHFAAFFREPLFNFGELTGNVVISSNVPIAGIELGFEGLEFFTLPSLPTIRRLDALHANIKIGAVYVYSSDRTPQQDVANRIGEGFAQFEPLMRRELALNGAMQNVPKLPVDRDESGLPKVLVVKLQKPREEYFEERTKKVDFNALWKEIEPLLPEDWKYQVIYYDLWKVIGNDIEGVGGENGGGGAFLGNAWISAVRFPFMKTSYFGDKRSYRDTPLPELGGQKPHWYMGFGKTLEDSAEGAFHLFSHELGHAMGLNLHTSVNYVEANTYPFKTIMNVSAWEGCFNPFNQKQQCVFSPMEASVLSVTPILNIDDYGWVLADPVFVFFKLTILSKEWNGNRVKVTLRLEHKGDGIHSLWLETGLNPNTHFWKLLGHTDNLENFVIEADIPDWWKILPPGSTRISVGVVDYHGKSRLFKIF